MLLKVDTLSKYYSIHEFSKIIGVSAQTLRTWDANGKLHPHHTRHSDEYAWLLSISNNVTKQAIKDACTAYKNFFKGLQKFPRFKSKKRSMPKFYQDNVKIRFSNTHVKFEG
ncbi:MerR family transcriptional regulator, partial [Ruminococcus sp. AM27-16]